MSKEYIKPFSDFWINCQFNMSFSILTSINKSYADLAALNCYTYSTSNVDWSPKHITLRNGSENQGNIVESLISKKQITFKNSSDWIEKIIYLLNNYNLCIGVDLYYWIAHSHAWGKKHDYHYSLVTNYDANREVFQVLDDDLFGFNLHEVPRTQFEIAVNNAKMKNDGFVINCKEPDNYTLDFDEVIYNARNIVNNLSTFLDENDYWSVSTNDREDIFYEFYAFELFKIVNRQIANVFLINRLNQLGFINSSLRDRLSIMLNELIQGWDIIKNDFTKHSISDEILNIHKINSKKNKLISKEIVAWQLLK